MAIDGWYYLHTNGSLLFKRDMPGIDADFRESDLVRAFWSFDTRDRATAWRVLVEALALGALRERIDELVDHWKCDDDDADVYGLHIGVLFMRDGDQWCAHRLDFVDLHVSPAGFGRTKLDAMAELAKTLGFKAQKTWGATFEQLCDTGLPI